MGDILSLAGPSKKSLIKQKISAVVILSLLFIIVYSTCNWLSSIRSDVNVFYFSWEKHIPLIPIFIIPYMSIDIFFVIAPFLCKDRKEIILLSQRIGVAILIAGAFFLLMPLTFAFPRPVPEGWTSAIFKFLHGFDQPYNMFPSLHITLRTILAEIYARKSKGFVRFLSHVWFSLIGFSTLFTYQHHVIDVVGGFVLALFIFYFIRSTPKNIQMVKNLRISWYYGAASAILIILTLTVKTWGFIFFWPAVSLCLITGAYLGIGPKVFKKENGKLPLCTKIIFAPYIIGQQLYLFYYYNKCNCWDKVLPNLWIGRKLSNSEASKAVEGGVTAVVDLTAEFSEAKSFLNVEYLNLQTLDLTAPTPDYLNQAVQFIKKHSEKGAVYVHCKIGYSRSAVIVGAYLISDGIAKSADEAIALIRKARPTVIVRKEAREAIESFCEEY